jgi:ribosomal protein S18 acetylase RimI-like enzyme
MNLNIRKVASDYPYNLLLLADETIEGINKYLFDSDVYTAELPDEEAPVGVFCLYPIDENTIELKNIAVVESYQGKGIGSVLLDIATGIAKEKGYREIIVGTADCGVGQIRFYERNGFVKYDVKKNFFLDIYEEPIYENGVQLKDMVMLKKKFVSILPAKKDDCDRLMLVWESAVKATHDFLEPEDFEFYKKIIPGFFSQVDLYVLMAEKGIAAFLGVSGNNIEMLFVSAEARGKGCGKLLLEYAINNLHAMKVDVNEQNKQAIGFYEKFGFRVIARSEKDSMGKDYPILHMSL